MTEKSARNRNNINEKLLEYRNGIRVSGTDLWLDARNPKLLSFVSHAHSDHLARHDAIIGTKPTLRFCREKTDFRNALEVPYKQPFSLGELMIELFPAGHMLGAAQILIRLPDSRGGVTIGYTGDFSMVPSLTADPAEQMKCDILIIESTFGKPQYVFPPKEEVLAGLNKIIEETIIKGRTPVIIAYPLGKSQETIKYLESKGHQVCAYKSVWDYCRIYEELGVHFHNLRRFDGETRHGDVIVIPHNADRKKALRDVANPKLIAVTGWALDPAARYRFGVEEAIPLSDHADFNGLVSYAIASQAKKILVTHGFTGEFAKSLQERGLDAVPMVQPRQLELKFAGDAIQDNVI